MRKTYLDISRVVVISVLTMVMFVISPLVGFLKWVAVLTGIALSWLSFWMMAKLFWTTSEEKDNLELVEKSKKRTAEVTALFTSTKHNRVCWCSHCQRDVPAYLGEQHDVSELISGYGEMPYSSVPQDFCPATHWTRSIITRYGYKCPNCGNMIDIRLEHCD